MYLKKKHWLLAVLTRVRRRHCGNLPNNQIMEKYYKNPSYPIILRLKTTKINPQYRRICHRSPENFTKKNIYRPTNITPYLLRQYPLSWNISPSRWMHVKISKVTAIDINLDCTANHPNHSTTFISSISYSQLKWPTLCTGHI